MTTITTHSSGIRTAGQPTAAQLDTLAAEGVTAVINLRAEQELDMIGFDEAATCEAAGLAYHWLPVSGPGDLTRDLVSEVASVLDTHDNVLVHCASSNRVGAVLALRAAWHKGASPQEAIAIGVASGLSSLKEHVKALVS